jgi:hypothetical protein
VDRFSIIWGKPGSTVELCKGDEILLTIKTIKLSDAGTYTLGLQRTGTDTMGVFSIRELPKPEVPDEPGPDTLLYHPWTEPATYHHCVKKSYSGN